MYPVNGPFKARSIENVTVAFDPRAMPYFTSLASTITLSVPPTTRNSESVCVPACLPATEANGIRITAPVTIMTRHYGILILYPVSWKGIVLFCRINRGVPTLMKSYGSNLGVIEVKRVSSRLIPFEFPPFLYLFIRRGKGSSNSTISRHAFLG